MKKKLDPIRTSDKCSPASLSPGLNDFLPRRNVAVDSRLSPALSLPMHSMQLPIHSRPIIGSPGRSLDTPVLSAVSPNFAPFSSFDQRSPSDRDYQHSPRGRPSRHNSNDATSSQSGAEYHGYEDMEIDDASSQTAAYRGWPRSYATKEKSWHSLV